MGTNIRQRIARLGPRRRAKIQTRVAQLVAEDLSLQELRKAMHRTQVELAKALKVGQDTISRYEQRTDMLLSTLQVYVQAMGGELELIARFPNRRPVRIRGIRYLGSGSQAR